MDGFSKCGGHLACLTFAIDLMAMSMRKNLKLARQEIMQRKQAEEQLRYQSMHDTLTGIYNRGFFEEELARLEHSREFPVSIIMADVDQLKVVNDTRGHAKGDELLQYAANILARYFEKAMCSRGSAATNLPYYCQTPTRPQGNKYWCESKSSKRNIISNIPILLFNYRWALQRQRKTI